jgi:hypothetical protein
MIVVRFVYTTYHLLANARLLTKLARDKRSSVLDLFVSDEKKPFFVKLTTEEAHEGAREGTPACDAPE